MAANDNTKSFKRPTFADNADSTLSDALSPNRLDKSASLDQAIATNRLIAGETSGYDQKSVTNFAEGSVGKVEDNTVPITSLIDDAVPTPTVATPKPVSLFDDVLPPQHVIPTYSGPAPVKNLQELMEANASNPQYRDADLPDYNRIPSRYFLPQSIGDSNLPKPAKNLLAKAVGSSEEKALERMKRDFLSVYNNNKEIEELLAKGTKLPDNLSRFEKTSAQLKQRIEDYRTGFEIKIERTGEKVKVEANPEMVSKLEKMDPVMYAAIKGYSDPDWSKNKKVAMLGYRARLNKQRNEKVVTDLNPQQGKWGVADYNYLNPVLRGLEPADAEKGAFKEIGKAFDSYIRLGTRGLNSLEEYQGTVYRGVDFSDNEALFNKLYKEGGTFTEKAFASTTRRGEGAFGGDVLLVINSRGGGRKIEGISGQPSELEVSFPPNRQFKVLKIETLDQPVKGIFGPGDDKVRKRIVYLDELPAQKVEGTKPDTGVPTTVATPTNLVQDPLRIEAQRAAKELLEKAARSEA